MTRDADPAPTAPETVPHPRSIAIVGGGVRGTAALGRLVAQLRHATDTRALTLHLVDPHPLGSGRIWRAGQPHTLVMNTIAAQSTVFDDDSLDFAHRTPGPTFAEWCAMVATGSVRIADTTPNPDEATALTELATHTQAWDSPSRALYGAYLRWAHAHLLTQLPDWVTVRTHAAAATALTRTGREAPRFTLTLATGERINLDAALLALGWLPRPQTDPHHVGPESPIDQPVARLLAGEHVAVRGLGMGFTDLCSLVTEARGGRFIAQPTADRPLAVRYDASGSEPVLHAGSRTGLPFLAKPSFGAVPPAPELVSLRARTPELVRLRAHGPLDFGALVLPLIERDSARAHYRTLAQHTPEAFAGDPQPLLALLDTPPAPHAPTATGWAAALVADAQQWRALADTLVTAPELRYDSRRIGAPVEGHTDTAIDAHTRARLDDDAREASLGARSARKMGWHTFQAARGAIVPLTDFGGVSAESTSAHAHYLYLAGLAGSGPPLFRVEQLIALHDAGLVRFIGPEMHVTALGAASVPAPVPAPADVTPQFAAWSAQAPGDRVTVTRVVDAFLSLPDARQLDDALLQSLLEGGLARTVSATGAAAGAIDITADSSTLVDSHGAPVTGLHSVGVLHEAVRQFTIIAPIPHANSTVLREIDAAVAAMLGGVSVAAG